MAAKTVVATTAFSAEVRGQEVLVRTGERFTSTHPLVKRYPTWFTDADADVKRPMRGSK
jgi:hypothetical protein